MKLTEKLKVRSALMKHQKGQKEEALVLYESLYRDGAVQAAYMLPYSVLLLRSGKEGAYEKVREIMVKAQKAPDLTDERRQQLLMNYAIAVWKLGDLDKAIGTLEASHRKTPCTLTYQALGFLYIETGDAEKALAYNQEAMAYDDEDAVTLDNLGQIYYRLMKDKKEARQYFEKAHEVKPKQIDTLYFLALYDEADGNLKKASDKLETALEGSFSPLNHVSRLMAQEAYDRIKNKLNKAEMLQENA